MKTSLMTATMALAMVSGMALAATAPQASFDTQLNQAKATIGRIADEGRARQNGSFDTQLNQAKAAIDKLAAEGLAAQKPVK